MLRLGILLLTVLLCMSSASFAAEPVVRISALAFGKLLLDGKRVSITDLDKALGELKTRNGAVFYYRENPGAEPQPEAMQALQMILKYKLAISMSTKADFSDYVDANGVSRPREP